MTTNAVILGGGMVGRAMAFDLVNDPDFAVSIADINSQTLDEVKAKVPGIKTITSDLSDQKTVKRLVSDYDIVLGAMPSVLGFQTLQAVIEAGKNYCDISFMPENALDLDGLAQEHKVTAIVDCGVAPGLSNMLAGYAVAKLDWVDDIKIYVGGLPRERHWPFEYKAGFSPYDVIEEYTRPSRIVKNEGAEIREALSEPELLEFDGVGTLEAFNTDGLRSLIHTVVADNMIEKTLRYPGHIEFMRVLRYMGLFSHEPIKVGKDQVEVRPIDVTAALLFPIWTYEPGEADLTVLRVIAEGLLDDKQVKLSWDLLDYYDEKTGLTSMSRTTAFPNTIAARLVASGNFSIPGVHAPENIGKQEGLLDHFIMELNERGVKVESAIETI